MSTAFQTVKVKASEGRALTFWNALCFSSAKFSSAVGLASVYYVYRPRNVNKLVDAIPNVSHRRCHCGKMTSCCKVPIRVSFRTLQVFGNDHSCAICMQRCSGESHGVWIYAADPHCRSVPRARPKWNQWHLKPDGGSLRRTADARTNAPHRSQWNGSLGSRSGKQCLELYWGCLGLWNFLPLLVRYAYC